ncbi:MAG: hypothetical protein BM555_06835 [Crocinitomix sp. MedPE-SWsnd]|jgi:Domain of unknown function (DUF4286)|nr:MAG: hypothetical protein BM555_06835 [Crocinitomix sp. MedPE-SWsnd]
MRVIYNVTINIDLEVHDEWFDWMKEVHIPDVMNTGLFLDARFSKILAEEEGGKSYSIQYLCESQEKLDDYQTNHSPKLQEEHTAKFRGRFVAFRTLLRVEKSF